MMKNAYFILKNGSIRNIRYKINFRLYDATTWLTNS